MKSSIALLAEAIAQSKNELEIHEQVMPKIAMHFTAKRYRMFFFKQLPIKISSLFKTALSTEHNPVLRYVMENHAPVHEGVLVTKAQWQTICPRFDHGHVMAGPIVTQGSLIGGLGITRDRHTAQFTQQNIVEMSALCLHLSTRIAQIHSKQNNLAAHNLNVITPREAQIAELVAQGLTNAQIGKNLWITENSVKQALKRIFRKLNVSSRAAMISRLYDLT